MKPRDFLNFFKTKSGKLVLFVAVFGAGLLVFSALRGKSGNDDMDKTTNKSYEQSKTIRATERQRLCRPVRHAHFSEQSRSGCED